MRYPNHLILDIQNNTSNILNSTNWLGSYDAKVISTLNLKKLNKTNTFFSKKNTLKLVQSKFNLNSSYTVSNETHSNVLWNIFDINFLRKEKIYTKLKYSRCPQYDMVSGGVAAIFAGFLGFLICEKFGLELLDSGDFYFLFMYAVFLTFSVRPFLRIMSEKSTVWYFFSYKPLFIFFRDLSVLTVNATKHYLGKIFNYHNIYYINIFTFLKNLEYVSTVVRTTIRIKNYIKWYPSRKY